MIGPCNFKPCGYLRGFGGFFLGCSLHLETETLLMSTSCQHQQRFRFKMQRGNEKFDKKNESLQHMTNQGNYTNRLASDQWCGVVATVPTPIGPRVDGRFGFAVSRTALYLRKATSSQSAECSGLCYATVKLCFLRASQQQRHHHSPTCKWPSLGQARR